MQKKKYRDYRGALLDITTAIKINSKDPQNYQFRGELNVVLKNYQSAINDFTKAIELDPKYASSYIDRGLVNIKLNRIDSACFDFSTAGQKGVEGAYELINRYCN
jgi:tetratricopeptide (TPR) repeat protein